MKTVDLPFILRVLHTVASIDYVSCIWWRTDGEYAPVSFFVHCSDLFYWATADCEDLTPDNIEEFDKAIADIQTLVDPRDTKSLILLHWAPELFVARVRKMRPQGAYYKHIDERLWDLFNGCGPARQADELSFGNPVEQPSGQPKQPIYLIKAWNNFIKGLKK